MEIFQLKKILNNTEVGSANTNDSYVYFKSAYQSFFASREDKAFFFIDKQTNTKVRLHVTFGRECRLNGLGEYVRDKGLQTGDMVLLERAIIDNNTTRWMIDYHKNNDNIFVLEFHKRENCFMPSNQVKFSQQIQLNNTFDTIYNGNKTSLKVTYHKKVKKRVDSPDEFDGYYIEGLDNLINWNILKKDHKIFIEVLNDSTCNLTIKTVNWEYQIINY